MTIFRELMADDRSAVSIERAVAPAFLGALLILGGWEIVESAADLYERAARGHLRA